MTETTDARDHYEFVETWPNGIRAFKRVTYLDGRREADMGVRYLLGDPPPTSPQADTSLSIVPWHSEIRWVESDVDSHWAVTVQTPAGDWFEAPIDMATVLLLTSRDGYKLHAGDRHFTIREAD